MEQISKLNGFMVNYDYYIYIYIYISNILVLVFLLESLLLFGGGVKIRAWILALAMHCKKIRKDCSSNNRTLLKNESRKNAIFR